MKYQVEYYFCETQTEEVEAPSAKEAERLMLETLANDHLSIGRPTDMMFGIRDVREVEQDEIEE